VLGLVFAAQSGVVATRYYLPAYALFAVALALSLARLPSPLPQVAVTGIVVVQLAGLLAIALPQIPPPGARAEVERWAANEEGNGVLVREVAGLERSGCVVAVAGLHVEEADALPVLVSVVDPGPTRACVESDSYLVIGPREEGSALASACAPGALEELVSAGAGTLARCRRLGSEPVRDPTLGILGPAALVAERRFHPNSKP
jgi:hypothetical protein